MDRARNDPAPTLTEEKKQQQFEAAEAQLLAEIKAK